MVGEAVDDCRVVVRLGEQQRALKIGQQGLRHARHVGFAKFASGGRLTQCLLETGLIAGEYLAHPIADDLVLRSKLSCEVAEGAAQHDVGSLSVGYRAKETRNTLERCNIGRERRLQDRGSGVGPLIIDGRQGEVTLRPKEVIEAALLHARVGTQLFDTHGCVAASVAALSTRRLRALLNRGIVDWSVYASRPTGEPGQRGCPGRGVRTIGVSQIAVPPGEHTVELRFESDTLALGVVISPTAGVLLALVGLLVLSVNSLFLGCALATFGSGHCVHHDQVVHPISSIIKSLAATSRTGL
jgi:hypothetical protein